MAYSRGGTLLLVPPLENLTGGTVPRCPPPPPRSAAYDQGRNGTWGVVRRTNPACAVEGCEMACAGEG